ncbi:hypothetical protein KY289_000773 [Solanum tuberosum]|nr:hypothetical protein KY289_000773 [Solanum tuberosum]
MGDNFFFDSRIFEFSKEKEEEKRERWEKNKKSNFRIFEGRRRREERTLGEEQKVEFSKEEEEEKRERWEKNKKEEEEEKRERWEKNKKFQEIGLKPDKFTFPVVLKVSGHCLMIGTGGSLHSMAVKLGFSSDLHVNNTLLRMYAGFGVIRFARQVFDEVLQRDIVSWSSMMAAYVHCTLFMICEPGKCVKAEKFYSIMWRLFKMIIIMGVNRITKI